MPSCISISIPVPIRLSQSQSLSLSLCSICLCPISLSLSTSITLAIYSTYPSTHLSIYLSVDLSVFPGLNADHEVSISDPWVDMAEARSALEQSMCNVLFGNSCWVDFGALPSAFGSPSAHNICIYIYIHSRICKIHIYEMLHNFIK